MTRTHHIFRIRTLAIGLVAALAVAIVAAPNAGASPPARDLAATTPPTHTVLATIEHDGRTFEFVQSTQHGIVGVAEISRVERSTLLTSPQLQDATPLEVFRSIAGERAIAPIALVRDHQAIVRAEGRATERPRTFDLTAGQQTQARGSHDYIGSRCSYNPGYIGDSRFTHDWYLDTGMHKDFTAQQTYQYEDLNGTNGKAWLAGQTMQRWLSACNGNWIHGFPAFSFKAQIQVTGHAWVSVYGTQLEPYHKVTYSSLSLGHPKWRVLLSEMGYDVFLNRIYGVAVAGNNAITDMTIAR